QTGLSRQQHRDRAPGVGDIADGGGSHHPDRRAHRPGAADPAARDQHPGLGGCHAVRRGGDIVPVAVAVPSRLGSGHRHHRPDDHELDHSDPRPTSPEAAGRGRSAQRLARRQHIEPQRELVLTEDPTNCSLWWAARYVLRVRTNVVIIITSALGYFFFSGLRSFALLFTTDHYRLSKPVASALTLVVGLGALA